MRRDNQRRQQEGDSRFSSSHGEILIGIAENCGKVSAQKTALLGRGCCRTVASHCLKSLSPPSRASKGGESHLEEQPHAQLHVTGSSPVIYQLVLVGALIARLHFLEI